FSWTFYDGQGNYETSCCSDNNQPASEFELTFGKSGWHRAVLTVGINPTSTIETTFGTEMEEVNTGNGSLSKNKLDKDVLKDLLKVVLVLVVVFVIYYLLKKRSKKKFRQVKVKKKR
ncbi:MAG: hypothetical protein ABIE22_05590, partial [archaeon]